MFQAGLRERRSASSACRVESWRKPDGEVFG